MPRTPPSFPDRITIERLVDPPPQDEFGEPIETWEQHAERWASVEPFQGSEFLQAQQTQSAVDHLIRLRYDALTAQITPTMRVRHGAKMFDIDSVQDLASIGERSAHHEQIHLVARVRA